MERINSLSAIISAYRVVFCDIWGVVHNGIAVDDKAVHVLRQLRRQNIVVVLLTNSPRLSYEVGKQLEDLGATADIYDFIVTSGDATQALIEQGPRRLFHIGPDRDLHILDGLDKELAELEEAEAILCTGLYDAHSDTIDDYQDILRRARSRDLPFICANPDLQVWRGDKLLYCAGALAKEYSLLGGRCLIAGKPHGAIYNLAYDKAKSQAGGFTKNEILAIGDGLLTDIKGADAFNIDSLYVVGGVDRAHFIFNGQFSETDFKEFIRVNALQPRAYMFSLQ